jgi:hypothetical protein
MHAPIKWRSTMIPALQTLRTIELAPHQLLAVDLKPGMQLRLLCGSAWLTAEGESADRVLQAGEAQALRPGRLLIEGLGPARLQLSEGAGRRPRLWRWLQRQRARLQFGPVGFDGWAA